MEERLDHKTLRVTILKYSPGYKKHKHELVYEPKIQPKVSINCRTTSAHSFRTKLAFK